MADQNGLSPPPALLAACTYAITNTLTSQILQDQKKILGYATGLAQFFAFTIPEDEMVEGVVNVWRYTLYCHVLVSTHGQKQRWSLDTLKACLNQVYGGRVSNIRLRAENVLSFHIPVTEHVTNGRKLS